VSWDFSGYEQEVDYSAVQWGQFSLCIGGHFTKP
jgi:hypothetical protein